MLCLDDVRRMIAPEPLRIDPETKAILLKQKEEHCQRRIDQVYKHIEIFQNIWPPAQPIDYYIALMMCRDSKQTTFRKLFNPHFLLQVLWMGETFGYHHFTTEEKKDYVFPNFWYRNIFNKVEKNGYSTDIHVKRRRRKQLKPKVFVLPPNLFRANKKDDLDDKENQPYSAINGFDLNSKAKSNELAEQQQFQFDSITIIKNGIPFTAGNQQNFI